MAQTKVTPKEQSNIYMFSAYRAGNQSVSGSQYDTVVFDTEAFDYSSSYNTSNGFFTAPVAGWYQFNASVRADTVAATYVQMLLADFKVSDRVSTINNQNVLSGSVLKYMAAGASAAVSIYHNGTATFVGTIGESSFSGFLVCT